MIAPFSEHSPSSTHRAKHFVWITSFILVRTMRVCILIPTLQGNCGVVWSVAFLRPLHPTDTWTKAAGRSLLLRFGSSKADLETRNQVPSGNVEVVPGKLAGVWGAEEKQRSVSRWAGASGLIVLGSLWATAYSMRELSPPLHPGARKPDTCPRLSLWQEDRSRGVSPQSFPCRGSPQAGDSEEEALSLHVLFS